LWFASTISEEKFQAQASASGEIVEILIRLLCEPGFGGVAMNFKPFESKVLS